MLNGDPVLGFNPQCPSSQQQAFSDKLNMVVIRCLLSLSFFTIYAKRFSNESYHWRCPRKNVKEIHSSLSCAAYLTGDKKTILRISVFGVILWSSHRSLTERERGYIEVFSLSRICWIPYIRAFPCDLIGRACFSVSHSVRHLSACLILKS